MLISVSNLSDKMTRADVESLFRPFGPAKVIFRMGDKAYVSMPFAEDANWAIQMVNGADVKGRLVFVRRSLIPWPSWIHGLLAKSTYKVEQELN